MASQLESLLEDSGGRPDTRLKDELAARLWTDGPPSHLNIKTPIFLQESDWILSTEFKPHNKLRTSPCAGGLLIHGPPGFGTTDLAIRVLEYLRSTDENTSCLYLHYLFDARDARSCSEEALARSLLCQVLSNTGVEYLADDFIESLLKSAPEAHGRLGSAQQLWNRLTAALTHRDMGPVVVASTSPMFADIIDAMNRRSPWGEHLSDVRIKTAELESSKASTSKKMFQSQVNKVTLSHRDFLQNVFHALSEKALLILSWMTLARRPLSVNELSVALALNGKQLTRYDVEEGICLSTAVPRILVSPAAAMSLTHRDIAERCVSYLLMLGREESRSPGLEKLRSREVHRPDIMDFARYAFAHWCDHCRLVAEPPQTLTEGVKQLLGDPVMDRLLLLMDPKNQGYPTPGSGLSRTLILASSLGLHEIVKDVTLVQKDQPVSVSDYEASLWGAARAGYGDIVKTLTTVAGQEVSLLPPILAASQGGHLDLLKDLLDRTMVITRTESASNWNVSDQSEAMLVLHVALYPALISACEKGHLEVVKELLHRGTPAFIPTPSEKEGHLNPNFSSSPLHIAAQYGHTDIIDVLLANIDNLGSGSVRAKAALESVDTQDYTPLQRAGRGKFYDTVEKLLSYSQGAVQINQVGF
ncbi:hypothetical protein V8F20_010722 [Naviculisporaceae sp. PSN 640]